MTAISIFFSVYAVFLVITWVVLGGISTAKAAWNFEHEWVINWEVFNIIPSAAFEYHIPKEVDGVKVTTWIDFRYSWLFFEGSFGIVQHV